LTLGQLAPLCAQLIAQAREFFLLAQQSFARGEPFVSGDDLVIWHFEPPFEPSFVRGFIAKNSFSLLSLIRRSRERSQDILFEFIGRVDQVAGRLTEASLDEANWMLEFFTDEDTVSVPRAGHNYE
jgi:hypothetical protein